MHSKQQYLTYQQTGYFSALVNNYTSNPQSLSTFFSFAPSLDGINEAIEARAQYPVNREALVTALQQQYAHIEVHSSVAANISKLANADTFTVCTAHQPNLMTGYLYFIYKILHAVKLADHLNHQHPGKHFIPVYYMGSEDNDLEELGVFRYRDNKYTWDGGGQTGAVGRMDTASLKTLLHDLFKVLGPPGDNCDDLQDMITQAYLHHNTIAAATLYLVNRLFGRFGLVIINPDDALLKKQYIPVIKDELLHSNALPVITAQSQLLAAHYKPQGYARDINLFYLGHQLRERIERHGDTWVVLNTEITWNKEQLMAEVDAHPERFSPNVMLRGMFQETILPNVAFIGGGAEVAYWLQLKTLFQHYHVFYPCILLRQSALFVSPDERKLLDKTGLSITDLFEDDATLARQYISEHTDDSWKIDNELNTIADIMQRITTKATSTDATLQASAAAAHTRINKRLHTLEQKMLRALKKKNEVQLNRMYTLKERLFPGGSLQERTDNFASYYIDNGPAFLDIILSGIDPEVNEFMIIEIIT